MHPRAVALIEASQKKLANENLSARNAFRLACLTVNEVFQSDDDRKDDHIDHLETIWDSYIQDSDSDSIEQLFDDLDAALAMVALLAVHGNETRKSTPEANGRVFVVHGHDLELRDRVTLWVQSVSKKPIVLAEQPGSSKTVIELIENFGLVEYAICLLTADDLGGVKGADLKPRARQNVILEVGYFFALLGRNRVSVVADASLELPSDVVGLRPIILGPGTNLEKRLADDMIHAGVLSESSA